MKITQWLIMIAASIATIATYARDEKKQYDFLNQAILESFSKKGMNIYPQPPSTGQLDYRNYFVTQTFEGTKYNFGVSVLMVNKMPASLTINTINGLDAGQIDVYIANEVKTIFMAMGEIEKATPNADRQKYLLRVIQANEQTLLRKVRQKTLQAVEKLRESNTNTLLVRTNPNNADSLAKQYRTTKRQKVRANIQGSANLFGAALTTAAMYAIVEFTDKSNTTELIFNGALLLTIYPYLLNGFLKDSGTAFLDAQELAAKAKDIKAELLKIFRSQVALVADSAYNPKRTEAYEKFVRYLDSISGIRPPFCINFYSN